ncbi:MAG: hypothetical protein KatS3mg102_0242 [Planctomycetota bacterium]|nr:MAG: hypothetical protein KatS3mg102_0242 [Planctomycetota bacterium]
MPPERGEPLYEEATRLLSHWTKGREVTLCWEVEREDFYGRALAHVWVGERLVSAVLVRHGLAHVYTFPPNVRFAQTLVALQRQARAEGLGLWSLPPPAPEEIYLAGARQAHFHRPSCEIARRIRPEDRCGLPLARRGLRQRPRCLQPVPPLMVRPPLEGARAAGARGRRRRPPAASRPPAGAAPPPAPWR